MKKYIDQFMGWLGEKLSFLPKVGFGLKWEIGGKTLYLWPIVWLVIFILLFLGIEAIRS